MLGREGKTHFGFRTVDVAEKPRLVRGVFSNVARKYDLMNDVMSFGIHRVWKERMMDWLAPRAGQHLLDVAGGTGDIAFRFLRRSQGASVTVLDITPEMLTEGQKRSESAAGGEYRNAIRWVLGDAMALPFADNSFDCYTISFGIRNVTDIEKALSEAFRVVKMGGRIMILEFSTVTIPAFKRAYDFYSFNAIPALGSMITGSRESYQYLVESIRRFPDQASFSALIGGAGFETVEYRNLSGGIVALHSGWKI